MSSKMFCVVHLFVTDKSDHLVQSNIACILLALGRFEESLQPANKACELQPDWPKVCLLIIFYYCYYRSTVLHFLAIIDAVYSSSVYVNQRLHDTES